MPIAASDIEKSAYLRLLVLGAAKSGKTTTVLKSCEGPTYVINCDDKLSLKPAARFVTNFSFDLVTALDSNIFQQMENAIAEARKGVKEGKYKTIVWDTISFYARRIETILADSTDKGLQAGNASTGADGRRFWPLYKKRLINVIDRLFLLNAHVIVNAHYLDVGGAPIDGQLPKEGPGIVPMLGGSARVEVPGLFQDIVFLEKQKDGGRIFTTSISGVWGPGCRSLSGVESVEADIGVLWKKMCAEDRPATKKTK